MTAKTRVAMSDIQRAVQWAAHSAQLSAMKMVDKLDTWRAEKKAGKTDVKKAVSSAWPMADWRELPMVGQ